MSHKVLLTVDGESRSLLTYSHNYYRQKQKMKSFDMQSFFNTPIACDLRNGYRLDDFEHFSEPLPHILGGMFYVSFESTAKDDLFYYWMKDSEVLNGSIEFYNTLDEDDIPFQRIDFWDAFLVRIKEQTTQGAFPMIMECDISAAIVRINKDKDTTVRKPWYFSEIDKKPVDGDNEAQEEPMKLLVRKVSGQDVVIVGNTVAYKATEFTVWASAEDRQSIQWCIKVDNNKIRLNDKGDIINLKIKEEWWGKEILVQAYFNAPWDKIAQKTKILPNILHFYSNASNFVSFDKEIHQHILDSKENNRDGKTNFIFDDGLYIANSYQTLFGRDERNNYVGYFTGITVLSEFDLYDVIAQGSYIFYDIYMRSPIEDAVICESTGQFKRTRFKMPALDYKNEFYRISPFIFNKSINKHNLVSIDGIVYNANELGNYLWGMVLDYHACFISPNWLAEAGTRGRPDEPWEQRAITFGRTKGLYLLNKANLNEEIKDYILDVRLRYRQWYPKNE